MIYMDFTFFKLHFYHSDMTFYSLPPPVDAHIGGASVPGVQDVDAAQSVSSLDRVSQRRVVMQPQSFPEPVDGIYHHVISLLRIHTGKGIGVK